MIGRAARREPGSPPTPGPLPCDDLHAGVEAYYTAKLLRHGATPPGVDWSSEATQHLRFAQLLKICDFRRPCSLNDVGCGYGALAVFLAERHPDAVIDYLGTDIARPMVTRARRRHRGEPRVRFAVARTIPRSADYAVASGVMNVKLAWPVAVWEDFVRTMLEDMARTSRIGFAVNFLTSANPHAPANQLYCPDPTVWTRFCEDALGCAVTVVDGYGLREYTLLIRKYTA